jgi:hypothetical protein
MVCLVLLRLHAEGVTFDESEHISQDQIDSFGRTDRSVASLSLHAVQPGPSRCVPNLVLEKVLLRQGKGDCYQS